MPDRPENGPQLVWLMRQDMKFAIIALCAVAAVTPAHAADQVLTCTTEAGAATETQVLISEGLFRKGTILWPSQAGTAVFAIKEKTAVSYAAAEVGAAHAQPSRLYINRLNGTLHIEYTADAAALATLGAKCSGTIGSDECVRRFENEPASARSLCFVALDCPKFMRGETSIVQSDYRCRRSFKKF